MINLSFSQKSNIGLKYVLDLMEPVTPFGRELLKKQYFYGRDEKDALTSELRNVELLRRTAENERSALQKVIHVMSQFRDIRGTVGHLISGRLGEVELFQLNEFLLRFEQFLPLTEDLGVYKDLSGIEFSPTRDALAILDPADSGRLGFYIEDTRTPELLEIRCEKRRLEELLRRTGGEKDRESVKERRARAVSSEEIELERIYGEMSLALRPYADDIIKNIGAVGRLDFAVQKALLALRYGAVEPRFGGDTVRLKNATSPEISDQLEAQKRDFTPVSIEMPRGVTVLTGANMGGKSVALKTAALNVCLALLGCFVFCEEAEIPVFDGVELVSEDLSNTKRGLSSFGGEILRLNEIIDRLKAGTFSFIAMDEFARGTNSEEGAAIVRATVKFLNAQNAVILLATHYDGAAEYAEKHYQTAGLRDLDYTKAARSIGGCAKEGVRLIADSMNYGLFEVTRDTPCPREAVKICRLLGLEEEILGNIANIDE